VVECSYIGPRNRVVTCRAVADGERWTSAWVGRVVRLLPSRQVASGVSAIGRGNLQVVVIVDVALRAGNVRVPSRQRKSGRAVVELGVRPTIKVVAALAIRSGKCWSSAGVRWVCGILPILQMARLAVCG